MAARAGLQVTADVSSEGRANLRLPQAPALPCPSGLSGPHCSPLCPLCLATASSGNLEAPTGHRQ